MWKNKEKKSKLMMCLKRMLSEISVTIDLEINASQVESKKKQKKSTKFPSSRELSNLFTQPNEKSTQKVTCSLSMYLFMFKLISQMTYNDFQIFWAEYSNMLSSRCENSIRSSSNSVRFSNDNGKLPKSQSKEKINDFQSRGINRKLRMC